ncbi:dihydrolipoamide acetyltransferase family protein [Spiroplasma endosymbiont of Labia minor]|uniref:dihydrolipoamide acetyltransferase family protein n=1 Tax=Spiroplasma endosymbiont of Labia minor TaxID=3066305 RepID=UPI0030D12C68
MSTYFTEEQINSILQNIDIKFEEKEIALEFTEEPITNIRKTIASVMTSSLQTNAPFTGMRDLDVSAIVELREKLRGFTSAKNIKLTYLAFIVKAAALTIQKMSQINIRSNFEENKLILLKNINIGIAVDTARGLIVPVIKNVDKMSVYQIASKIEELANKARDGKLTLREVKDSTFTITNYGSVKLEYATPIINPPNSAILGVGGIKKIPVFNDKNEIISTYVIPFSMTADHRVIDGAEIGRFLIEFDNYMKNPLLLFEKF